MPLVPAPKEGGGMNNSLRVLLDSILRSVALLVLAESVAWRYAAANPSDDGIGTGLTVLFLLICAAALWGLWDGFHRGPVRLCVTWVVTGLVVSLGLTVYSDLQSGEWSWSVLAHDLTNGLAFVAGLIFVPAIICGVVQSAARHRTSRRGVSQRASATAPPV
jgi:hypothetical protein